MNMVALNKLFSKGGGRPDGPRTPDDPHTHQEKTGPGGHEDGTRRREVAEALGVTTVHQHVRTSQTGTASTVRQHQRKVYDVGVFGKQGRHHEDDKEETLERYTVVASSANEAKALARRLHGIEADDTGYSTDVDHSQTRALEPGEDADESGLLLASHEHDPDKPKLQAPRGNPRDLSYLNKGLTMRFGKSTVKLTFGKSTVKQHPRKNKSGKTSTVKQYTDSRTKQVHGSEGPKHEKTQLGIGVAITKIRGVARHRNGMSGAPFDVVSFDYMDPMPKPKLGEKPPKPGEPRQMVAVLFDEPGHIAVFDAMMLGEGKTAFGDNSWRGDQFEKPLRAAIEKNYKDLFPDKGKDKPTTAFNSAGKQVKVTIPPKETDEERKDAGRALDDDHKRQEANKP
jgi:hypothetical protein